MNEETRLTPAPIIPITAWQVAHHKVMKFPSVYDELPIICGYVRWRYLGAKLVIYCTWTGQRIPEE